MPIKKTHNVVDTPDVTWRVPKGGVRDNFSQLRFRNLAVYKIWLPTTTLYLAYPAGEKFTLPPPSGNRNATSGASTTLCTPQSTDSDDLDALKNPPNRNPPV